MGVDEFGSRKQLSFKKPASELYDTEVRNMAKKQNSSELETDIKTREEEKCGVCSSQQRWCGQVF